MFVFMFSSSIIVYAYMHIVYYEMTSISSHERSYNNPKDLDYIESVKELAH